MTTKAKKLSSGGIWREKDGHPIYISSGGKVSAGVEAVKAAAKDKKGEGEAGRAPDIQLEKHPDTTSLESDPHYGFFEQKAYEWTRNSDFDAKQEAFEYATEYFPELGAELRHTYFGEPDVDLPRQVSVYRVGGISQGVVSFFPNEVVARVYQKRFDSDILERVEIDPRELIPTGTGAGEIWGRSDGILVRVEL